MRVGTATDEEVQHFRRLRKNAVRNVGIATLCVVVLSAILILH